MSSTHDFGMGVASTPEWTKAKRRRSGKRGKRRDGGRARRVNRDQGQLGGRFDAGLERYLSQLQQQGDVATSRAQEERTGLYNETFDPTNPFAAQAMLKRDLDQSVAEQSIGMASRGQLYSGALEAGQSNLQHEGQRGQDQLYRTYADQMGQIDRGLADTMGGITSSADDAIWQSTQSAIGDQSWGLGKKGRGRMGGRGKGRGRKNRWGPKRGGKGNRRWAKGPMQGGPR